ncbi:hypothetical protein GCM10020331_073470 [Ectobacillus funiculus]
MLVGVVKKTEKNYEAHMKEGFYHVPVSRLKPGWQEAKYVALYVPKKWYGEKRRDPICSEKLGMSKLKKRNEIYELPSSKKQVITFVLS